LDSPDLLPDLTGTRHPESSIFPVVFLGQYGGKVYVITVGISLQEEKQKQEEQE
jgi:hypothetical protein